MGSRKIVVAGIGTDVGKTIVSAILCEALEADYWKPVQAGDLDSSDSMQVKNLVSNSQTVIHPEAYQLKTPMSPHAAADKDGIEIDPNKLVLPGTSNDLIIELAGGLMVPLTKNYLNIDWLKTIRLPVILVTNYYLGSINHTLLSIELLKARKIPIVGLVFNGDKNPTSFDAIIYRANTNCILELPWESSFTKKTVSQYAKIINI